MQILLKIYRELLSKCIGMYSEILCFEHTFKFSCLPRVIYQQSGRISIERVEIISEWLQTLSAKTKYKCFLQVFKI